MRRIPWDAMLALLAGLGLGLVYAWLISPRGISDATPVSLRAEFKDQYRSVIAAAYAATGNLPRAEARLSLVGDGDSVDALNGQAQRMLASGEQFEQADQVAALAFALEENPSGASVSTPTIEVVSQIDSELTSPATEPPAASEEPNVLTEIPPIVETSEITDIPSTAVTDVPTPRPTLTATAPLGEPFALSGQETICDTNLPDGLLQVLVLNSSRRQLAGMEIVVTWDGGKEQFFTGLKPELGNGYADYILTPDTLYAVQLARGSDVALDIVAPTCQTPTGETFFGSIKLTFQQP
ncbi:MAG TPA: hypothetical protein VK897_19225 [Anaerolineales bacterium]|nr:hypothetical protein [Anaerolineales bacterium]